MDFTGIDLPGLSLRGLAVPYVRLFRSKCDGAARRFLHENFGLVRIASTLLSGPFLPLLCAAVSLDSRTNPFRPEVGKEVG